MPNILRMPDTGYDLTRRYTVQEVLEFPDDGNRYELVDGELLVTPSPRITHQLLVSRMHNALFNYMVPFGLEHTVLCAPADITWGPRTLVQPDVFVMRTEEFTHTWETVKHLRLVVEVLSPSTERYDREVKRRAYQQNGVELYWIVNPFRKVIEEWTPMAIAPVVHAERMEWRHAPEAEALVIDVAALWKMPGGE